MWQPVCLSVIKTQKDAQISSTSNLKSMQTDKYKHIQSPEQNPLIENRTPCKYFKWIWTY